MVAKRKISPSRKTTAKKATKKPVKKTAAKKIVTKKIAKTKTTASKTRSKAALVKDAMTKSQILNEISDSTGLARKQIQEVLDSLSEIINRHVKKNAAGQFTLPGLLKVKVVRKPATRARKGINPFTGEETIFKAKPARNVVKILPLKKLKDMAA